MKIVYKGSLQRTMIIYFLMISLASFLITAEFIYDIHSKELRAQLIQNFGRLSGNLVNPDVVFQPVQALRDKAILMVTLFLIVVFILLMMFIKNISEPLQHMIEVSKLIAAGDLSQTVNINVNNELHEMGATVNELTSNLQEIILLSRDMCAEVDGFTGEISAVLGSQEIDQEKSEALRRKIHHLNSRAKFINDVIVNCKFFGMR
jgi:methyl-accepting chemotaxis protein